MKHKTLATCASMVCLATCVASLGAAFLAIKQIGRSMSALNKLPTDDRVIALGLNDQQLSGLMVVLREDPSGGWLLLGLLAMLAIAGVHAVLAVLFWLARRHAGTPRAARNLSISQHPQSRNPNT
jgi:hypothetical protein